MIRNICCFSFTHFEQAFWRLLFFYASTDAQNHLAIRAYAAAKRGLKNRRSEQVQIGGGWMARETTPPSFLTCKGILGRFYYGELRGRKQPLSTRFIKNCAAAGCVTGVSFDSGAISTSSAAQTQRLNQSTSRPWLPRQSPPTHQICQNLQPFAQNLIGHSKAQSEMRVAAAEHLAGDDQHVAFNGLLDKC